MKAKAKTSKKRTIKRKARKSLTVEEKIEKLENGVKRMKERLSVLRSKIETGEKRLEKLRNKAESMKRRELLESLTPEEMERLVDLAKSAQG